MSETPAPGFVWLSDEYSVPKATLCWHEPSAPNRDHRCIRAKGHEGRHLHRMAGEYGCEVRPYSHKDPRP